MTSRNWIAVASADHARQGCAQTPEAGFMQVCHGKATPLKRIREGDRIAYYSPTTTMRGKDKLQRFVSIGRVLPGEPYPVDMGHGFVPFRKDVAYVESQEASILPLVPKFEFVDSPSHWGAKFRFGLVEVNDHDMRLIAEAMQVDLAALALQPTRNG